MSMPQLTVIGGGTGIPVVLKALRKKDIAITAVVTVADDGGSSGVLRQATKVTPPGDLRNVLIAMSDMPAFYEEVLQYRFAKDDGPLAGRPIGNLLITGIAEMQGSTNRAMQILSRFFHTTGHIYPSSDTPLTLHAVFKDGTEVAGESHISKYTGMIDRVFVTDSLTGQEAHALPEVVEAIMASDMIVLGPGSLYTSVLPNLMIPAIKEALLKTTAEVVYICNIMTQRGETEHFSDADHVAVINHHLGEKRVDTVLVNRAPVQKAYQVAHHFDDYLVQVTHDVQGLRKEVGRIITGDFLCLEKGGAFHDGQLLTEELLTILEVGL